MLSDGFLEELQTFRTELHGLIGNAQVPWDACGAIVAKGDARAQARQVLQNMRGVLQAAGGDLSIW